MEQALCSYTNKIFYGIIISDESCSAFLTFCGYFLSTMDPYIAVCPFVMCNTGVCSCIHKEGLVHTTTWSEIYMRYRVTQTT